MQNINFIKHVENFTTFALILLAFSVSFGVAFVSLSCLLIVIAFIFRAGLDISKSSAVVNIPRVFEMSPILLILFSLGWFLLSATWTIADSDQVIKELIRYSRLLVIPLIYYLVSSRPLAILIIKSWIFGQICVLFLSYALWLKFPIDHLFSGYAVEFFTPFTSTLEQPIMMALMVAVTWFFRNDLVKSIGLKIALNFILIIAILNVFFLMIGRSGMLSMILSLFFILLASVSKKNKKYVYLFPLFLFVLLYFLSTNFSQRIGEIPVQIMEFQHGKLDSSQAIRLDFWHRSLQAIQSHPIIGYGVGSWPLAYKLALNGDVGLKADSPHQQFLLWWVEGGIVGLALLCSLFFSLFFAAYSLEMPAKNSLLVFISTLFFVSLMNCPLQGAGISEFFCVVIGTLLAFSKRGFKYEGQHGLEIHGTPVSVS